MVRYVSLRCENTEPPLSQMGHKRSSDRRPSTSAVHSGADASCRGAPRRRGGRFPCSVSNFSLIRAQKFPVSFTPGADVSSREAPELQAFLGGTGAGDRALGFENPCKFPCY